MEGRQATYRRNITALEQIALNIQSGEVDLDALAAEVERDRLLINDCRKKLRTTDAAVKRIMDNTSGAPGSDGVEQDSAGAYEWAPDLLPRDQECPPEDSDHEMLDYDADGVYRKAPDQEFIDPFALGDE
jgi:exodeoxyribonuclease VII small subunit